MNDLQKAIEQKLLTIISPPKNQVKRPHNRLWIALIAFNLIFFPLDVATAATVGIATYWYYGIWIFFSGFGTMVVHEALFSNPFAKIWQKVISVIGFIMSIGVTLLIGVGAIALNLVWTGFDRNIAGATMSIAAFIALFLHGILIAAYYFSDAGFNAKMRTTTALADSDRMVTEMAMAQVVVNAINELKTTLTQSVGRGEGAAMGAALNKITGQDWELPAAQAEMKGLAPQGQNPTNGQNGKP